jgi:hypothetical protein
MTEAEQKAEPTERKVPEALSDLVGAQILECIPKTDLTNPFDRDGNGCAFSMSGRIYLVFEDPNDGYRSSASPLISFAGSGYEIGWRYPEYLRHPVLCSMVGLGNEVLEMHSAETGKLVFRVGTDNSDDYYPSYVAEWIPQGLVKS